MFADQCGDFFIRNFSRVKSFHINRKRISDTNRISNLDFTAISNASRNNIDNVDLYARPAKGACLDLATGSGFDLVVLDPPRRGAKEVVDELIQAPVSRILYVSCDPMTLARDVKSLQSGGFELVECRPIDMFPQTYHLESISLLKRA